MPTHSPFRVLPAEPPYDVLQVGNVVVRVCSAPPDPGYDAAVFEAQGEGRLTRVERDTIFSLGVKPHPVARRYAVPRHHWAEVREHLLALGAPLGS